MKKDKRILALVLAAAMMGTTALPVWAQTPETADSSVVEVEGTLENIIAAREALAAQPATLAEDDNNIQAAQTMVERVANAVKNHTETAEKVNIKDLNLDKDLVLSTLADLNARVEGGEAISKLSCYYSRDTGLAVAIGLEYCTAQDVAAMQVKLDQLVDQANTLCQTDLEKVFYVHEWLVQNIAYDREHLSDDVQDDHNLRGALLEGTAVCDGYAKTYALTLRKLGITGVLVTSKDIGHAWNMVELDGNWYQVDCTWDDPVDGSDQLGYCMHKHLLCTTEEMNTNHNDDGDDSVAFDLENLGTQNIVNLATDDTYENTWWKDKKSAIFPCGGDWYYASGERLFWRDDLGDCDSNLAHEDDSGVVAGSIALDGTLLVATDKQACEQSSWIKQYELDPASHEVTEKKKESLQSIGIAAQWDGIYYAVSQQEYHQDVRQYIKTRDIPVPTATPTAVPTATPTATPTAAPTATPTVAPTATPTATPAATPVKPTAAPTATPVKPTATPASGYTGWKTVNGKDYWYEN
ncbi:MAG: transglutaminase domain-containing protein, partial [Gemmiger qucibialis]